MPNEKLIRKLLEWRKDSRETARYYSDKNEVPTEHFFRGAFSAYDRILVELGYNYLSDEYKEKEGE